MDWIACFFELIAVYLLGEKKWYSFVFFMIGNVFWFISGFSKGIGGLMTTATIFFVLNIRNLIKWTRKLKV